MENKKNYVDGVDVSGCEHYRVEIETKMPYGEYETQQDKCHYLGIEIIQNCKGNKGCIYKQLKRLECQYENVLKIAKENADSNEYCLKELEQENERLKEENYGLNQELLGYKKGVQASEIIELKQALQEIREIILSPEIIDEETKKLHTSEELDNIVRWHREDKLSKIQDKINEVIGEK